MSSLSNTPDALLSSLDEDQVSAVTAPAGPVCILAGAGSGKTRTITHRIAYRVLTGDTAPQNVMAVTFTTRAAGELRSRLRELGASGVSARTFHSAALKQLRYFAPTVFEGRAMPQLLEKKAKIVTLAAHKLGVRLERPQLRDLTSEIEWAKAMCIEPGEYIAAAQKYQRDLPFSAPTVQEMFTEYENAKRAQGVIDFEDLLAATVWAIQEHPTVAAAIRGQYRSFVVDEYQDVNPLQQRLLETWLGGRCDLTVVGDVQQTIYSFAGATSEYLVQFPRRFPDAHLRRLQRNYRSSPQIVSAANRVIAHARGESARLRLELKAEGESGPEPMLIAAADEPEEAALVAQKCQELIKRGVPASGIAVLFRANSHSATYEAALAERSVPYVLSGAEKFFDRPEVRHAMVLLRGAARSYEVENRESESLTQSVVAVLASIGFHPDQPPSGGVSREKWETLSAIVQLSEEFSATQENPTLRAFTEELTQRETLTHVPTVQGVTLASLHSAKGMEWDAVFLVGLVEGNMPIAYATTPEQVEEERRLFYVGVTRARRFLHLSWAQARTPGARGGRRLSRFLPRGITDVSGARSAESRPVEGVQRSKKKRLPVCRQCGVTLFDAIAKKRRRCMHCPAAYDEALYEKLRAWRTETASEQKLPAYCVFTDATLEAITTECPSTREALLEIPGVGPRKLELYADAVLGVLGGACG